MIWFLVVQLIALPLLLAAMFPVAIKFEHQGQGLIAILLVLDVYLNYTTFALYTLDFPRKGEYTFSQRLRRLVLDAGWRGFIAEHVKAFLNHFDPDHV